MITSHCDRCCTFTESTHHGFVEKCAKCGTEKPQPVSLRAGPVNDPRERLVYVDDDARKLGRPS